MSSASQELIAQIVEGKCPHNVAFYITPDWHGEGEYLKFDKLMVYVIRKDRRTNSRLEILWSEIQAYIRQHYAESLPKEKEVIRSILESYENHDYSSSFWGPLEWPQLGAWFMASRTLDPTDRVYVSRLKGALTGLLWRINDLHCLGEFVRCILISRKEGSLTALLAWLLDSSKSGMSEKEVRSVWKTLSISHWQSGAGCHRSRQSVLATYVFFLRAPKELGYSWPECFNVQAQKSALWWFEGYIRGHRALYPKDDNSKYANLSELLASCDPAWKQDVFAKRVVEALIRCFAMGYYARAEAFYNFYIANAVSLELERIGSLSSIVEKAVHRATEDCAFDIAAALYLKSHTPDGTWHLLDDRAKENRQFSELNMQVKLLK